MSADLIISVSFHSNKTCALVSRVNFLNVKLILPADKPDYFVKQRSNSHSTEKLKLFRTIQTISKQSKLIKKKLVRTYYLWIKIISQSNSFNETRRISEFWGNLTWTVKHSQNSLAFFKHMIRKEKYRAKTAQLIVEKTSMHWNTHIQPCALLPSALNLSETRTQAIQWHRPLLEGTYSDPLVFASPYWQAFYECKCTLTPRKRYRNLSRKARMPCERWRDLLSMSQWAISFTHWVSASQNPVPYRILSVLTMAPSMAN